MKVGGELTPHPPPGKTTFKKPSLIRIKEERASNTIYPANISLLKINNRNVRKRCEICSMLTIKAS